MVRGEDREPAVIAAVTVAAGGIGAAARYVASGLVQSLDGRFPVGTMFVNLTGAFTIGLAVGAADTGTIVRGLLFGFLGGYTTFSTWTFESIGLVRSGQRQQGATNVLLTLVGGLVLCGIGFYLTN